MDKKLKEKIEIVSAVTGGLTLLKALKLSKTAKVLVLGGAALYVANSLAKACNDKKCQRKIKEIKRKGRYIKDLLKDKSEDLVEDYKDGSLFEKKAPSFDVKSIKRKGKYMKDVVSDKVSEISSNYKDSTIVEDFKSFIKKEISKQNKKK